MMGIECDTGSDCEIIIHLYKRYGPEQTLQMLEELKIRERIRAIEEKKIEENDYYDILSGFEEVGRKELEITERNIVLLPALGMILMVISFLLYNVFNYIKDYEE